MNPECHICIILHIPSLQQALMEAIKTAHLNDYITPPVPITKDITVNHSVNETLVEQVKQTR